MSKTKDPLMQFSPYVPDKTTFEKKNFSIEDFAAQQGLSNNPPTTDTEFDEGQSIIRNGYFKDHTHEKERATNYLSEAKSQLELIKTKISNLNIESICDKLSIELKVKKSIDESTLKELSRGKYEKLRQKNFYKKTNKIFGDANYPESTIFHFAILFAIAIAESIANSYFFAQGNDLGLLGGYLEATLISIVNVGSSLLIGVYLLPYKNYIKFIYSLISYLVLLAFGLFIIFFNLGVGHYRDLRSLDPLTPVTNSLETLLKDPLNLTLNGAMLFAIGIGVAIYATSKAYKSDDPYPKYGHIDREHKKADKKHKNFEEKCKYDLKELFQNAITEIGIDLQGASTNLNKFGEYLSHVDNVFSVYKNSSKTINNRYLEALKQYRSTNIQIRTSPTPEYFEEYASEFISELENQNWVDSFHSAKVELAKHVETNEVKRDTEKKRLEKLLEEELRNLQAVISNIDKGMAKDLREQDQFMMEKDKI
jgi:hypothetical protein